MDTFFKHCLLTILQPDASNTQYTILPSGQCSLIRNTEGGCYILNKGRGVSQLNTKYWDVLCEMVLEWRRSELLLLQMMFLLEPMRVKLQEINPS